MLMSMKALLDHANANNYAVMAPNVFYELDARACIKAAEEMRAPVILDVDFDSSPDVVVQGWYYRKLAEMSSVPVAINQDHGADFTHSIAAIRGGYTSIMVDRSFLPYEENVAQVKELVRIAHAVGVTVEAELGHVGSAADDPADWKKSFTKPEEAKRFVEETGVDCLAVAIGTAHGLYKGTPTLDFDLLKELKETLKIPLVLHGGSGTGDENIRKACTMGINKVNVCSELLQHTYMKLQSIDWKNDNLELLPHHFEEGFTERLKELMVISGSAGKAWVEADSTGLLGRKVVFGEGKDIPHFI
ncbi:MAG: class II fructose-bisphosphate aldolase [Ruminococcaceae bacterium]|nr:class II fructose-bisphosphate aldolase [Oscillospiraceae bacterium]